MIERHPLSWPTNKPRTIAGDRKRANFGKKDLKGWKQSLTIAQAIQRLLDELDAYTPVGRSYRVPEESIIISSNLITGVKGFPLSKQPEPADPGVAVYFELDGQNYCLPCDKWDRVADNIAAVAAHIGALRGIERWGVGQLHDVYTGFKALAENAGASTGNWWDVLQVSKDAHPGIIQVAYRRWAKQYHPDNAATGDREKFDQVQQAYEQAKKEGRV